MTVTEFGYCPHCDDRVELVMTSAGILACCRCDAVDHYASRRAYENAEEVRS